MKMTRLLEPLLHPRYSQDKAKNDRILEILRFYRSGLSLRKAAEMAGVHVSTVCRWQREEPKLREALQRTREQVRDRRRLLHEQSEAPVQWHSQCPKCKAKVVVRSTAKGRRFWRCGRWPWCEWASWRPRHRRNCHKCGSPRYWSHSRKSVCCSGCGLRTFRH